MAVRDAPRTEAEPVLASVEIAPLSVWIDRVVGELSIDGDPRGIGEW